MSRAFYNDIGPYCCDWLSNLMDAGMITPGKISDKSIEDISADELVGYTRVHLFAGIGGWELALRLAGWPADRPVWTGSCPCQPFSAAGSRMGTTDKRHLWPYFRRFIAQHKPPTVFGEQVASRLGRQWFAGVRSNLEALGYAVGGGDLCAAGAGAPHIRQRLWFVADADGRFASDGELQRSGEQRQQPQDGVTVGNATSGGCGEFWDALEPRRGGHPDSASIALQRGFWDTYDAIPCTDGKARRVESGTFPLAHGIPVRTSKLRAYGNAIVPQIAARFIRAFMDVAEIAA